MEEQNSQDKTNNIGENILIDNSKNIEENKKMQNKEETKNGLFILGGATIVLAVIGIIVIVWKKRK